VGLLFIMDVSVQKQYQASYKAHEQEQEQGQGRASLQGCKLILQVIVLPDDLSLPSRPTRLMHTRYQFIHGRTKKELSSLKSISLVRARQCSKKKQYRCLRSSTSKDSSTLIGLWPLQATNMHIRLQFKHTQAPSSSIALTRH
jgi:hypothetical protein